MWCCHAVQDREEEDADQPNCENPREGSSSGPQQPGVGRTSGVLQLLSQWIGRLSRAARVSERPVAPSPARSDPSIPEGVPETRSIVGGPIREILAPSMLIREAGGRRDLPRESDPESGDPPNEVKVRLEVTFQDSAGVAMIGILARPLCSLRQSCSSFLSRVSTQHTGS